MQQRRAFEARCLAGGGLGGGGAGERAPPQTLPLPPPLRKHPQPAARQPPAAPRTPLAPHLQQRIHCHIWLALQQVLGLRPYPVVQLSIGGAGGQGCQPAIRAWRPRRGVCGLRGAACGCASRALLPPGRPGHVPTRGWPAAAPPAPGGACRCWVSRAGCMRCGRAQGGAAPRGLRRLQPRRPPTTRMWEVQLPSAHGAARASRRAGGRARSDLATALNLAAGRASNQAAQAMALCVSTAA
jgi:hypothetical protein